MPAERGRRGSRRESAPNQQDQFPNFSSISEGFQQTMPSYAIPPNIYDPSLPMNAYFAYQTDQIPHFVPPIAQAYSFLPPQNLPQHAGALPPCFPPAQPYPPVSRKRATDPEDEDSDDEEENDESDDDHDASRDSNDLSGWNKDLIAPPVLDPIAEAKANPHFPSPYNFECMLVDYLKDLSPKKRDKSILTTKMYNAVKSVLEDPQNTTAMDAQFRFWAKKTFSLTEYGGDYVVIHDKKPVAVKETMYEVLCHCHNQAGHGGRDKTSAQYYSWIPKDIVARFVRDCPFCQSRRTQSSASLGQMSQSQAFLMSLHQDIPGPGENKEQPVSLQTAKAHARALGHKPYSRTTSRQMPSTRTYAPNPAIAQSRSASYSHPAQMAQQQQMAMVHPGDSAAMLRRWSDADSARAYSQNYFQPQAQAQPQQPVPQLQRHASYHGQPSHSVEVDILAEVRAACANVAKQELAATENGQTPSVTTSQPELAAISMTPIYHTGQQLRTSPSDQLISQISQLSTQTPYTALPDGTNVSVPSIEIQNWDNVATTHDLQMTYDPYAQQQYFNTAIFAQGDSQGALQATYVEPAYVSNTTYQGEQASHYPAVLPHFENTRNPRAEYLFSMGSHMVAPDPATIPRSPPSLRPEQFLFTQTHGDVDILGNVVDHDSIAHDEDIARLLACIEPAGQDDPVYLDPEALAQAARETEAHDIALAAYINSAASLAV